MVFMQKRQKEMQLSIFERTKLDIIVCSLFNRDSLSFFGELINPYVELSFLQFHKIAANVTCKANQIFTHP